MSQEMYSPNVYAAAKRAFRLAFELGQEHVDTAHVLWGISRIDCAASRVLQRAGLDSALIREAIEKLYGKNSGGGTQYMYLSPEAARIGGLAETQAEKLKHASVEPEHILLTMLQEPECRAARVMLAAGAKLDPLKVELLEQMGKTWPAKPKKGQEEKGGGKPGLLDKFSRDLTADAGALDPVIGRGDEIQRVVQILSRRTKNNPVLIGEPGVGKTAIAEGLAQRIVDGDIPEELLDKRVVTLDLPGMLAGAKFRGDFEERIKGCIEEAVARGNVILFIDELHTVIGAGASEGAMDAANILKPALGRGELQVIGATTLDEYRKHIEKDAALERRFQQIQVDEPSQEDAVAILTGLRERYEQHHKLTITDEAVHAAVRMSSRYIQDRYLPDKAIDLIDEAASRVRTHRQPAAKDRKATERRIAALESEKREAVACQDFERAAQLRDQQQLLRGELDAAGGEPQAKTQVTAEDVAAVVSMWTGVPVTMLTEDEGQRLLRLERTLHGRVVGQDEAVQAVSKAIRRSRVGIKDPKRPMGAFLFLGPTGVGKTELCKALAEAMFQDEEAMLRVDMSEFMEQHTVSKLIGSPPGYIGYDEGGQLTELVRRKPYSVILFDEIEKAHQDVWNILLQIMEDGRLTDAQGRRVDFKNAIIVMTSNVGARNIAENRLTLGFGTSTAGSGTRPVDEIREKVMEDLKKTFRPEFLNRIDDIIVFHQLERGHIQEIARNMIQSLRGRMQELGVGLEVDDEALAALVDKGFDPQYGARPLRRVIQSGIEDAAAELLLEAGPQAGGAIRVTARDGELHVSREETASAEPAPEPETSTVHA